MVKHNEFGEFVKNRRIQLGYSLRRFSVANSFCPTHLSKMESGKIKPYQSNSALTDLAVALEIWPGTKLYKEMKVAWEASMRVELPEFFQEVS